MPFVLSMQDFLCLRLDWENPDVKKTNNFFHVRRNKAQV